MQVKKFEARTMKEALEMVKKQLGPEAIILGARDNRKSFGLVGEGSVEITAAISDEVLQKKQFTESRMRPQEREKFQSAPARVQKQVVEKFVNHYMEENKPQRPTTRTRYIEIDDEVEMHAGAGAGAGAGGEGAQIRIKSAAQRAWSAMQSGDFPDEFVREEPLRRTNNGATISRAAAQAQAASKVQNEAERSELTALRSELAGLKQALSQFQKVPQNMVTGHPGADFGLSYEFSSTFEKLTQAGVTPEIAADILNQAQTQMPPIRFKNKALVDAWTARYILDSTKITGEKPMAKIQIFVGPAGSGKTSSLVKLAAHAAVNEGKKVALLTADTFKVGAVDQMRIYANILNVPFAIVRRSSDWDYLMGKLSQFDLILCDFPGMGVRNVDEITRLRNLMPTGRIDADIHLVLPCSAKTQDLLEIGKGYKVANYTDVIFTGLDESVQAGNIYNFMRHFNVPLHSFGVGPRVPEDFELATRERVLDLIFKLTKMKKAE